MNLEAIAVTGASATAIIAALYEVAVRGGRHTRRIMTAVQTIERHSAELVPNHGSSLRDRVDTIAEVQQAHTAALAEHADILANVQSTMTHVAVVVAEHATAAHPAPVVEQAKTGAAS